MAFCLVISSFFLVISSWHVVISHFILSFWLIHFILAFYTNFVFRHLSLFISYLQVILIQVILFHFLSRVILFNYFVCIILSVSFIYILSNDFCLKWFCLKSFCLVILTNLGKANKKLYSSRFLYKTRAKVTDNANHTS